jgi:hypothetical protein
MLREHHLQEQDGVPVSLVSIGSNTGQCYLRCHECFEGWIVCEVVVVLLPVSTMVIAPSISPEQIERR